AVGLPAAMPHEVIDERLELLPSLMTQVDHARSVYEHLHLCVGRLRPADVQNLPEDAKPLAEHDWKAEAACISPVTDQLVERLIDLAVLQVRDMVAILGNRSARYQDRFQAAQRLRKSLALIDTHWKRYEQRSERDPSARS